MKKLLALMLCLVLAFGIVACGETPDSGSSDAGNTAGSSDAASDTAGSSDSEEEEWEPLEVMEDKVIVTDQRNSRVVVYDLSLVGEDGNLDTAEVWVLENHYSASIKYREDTIYGNVVLITSGGAPRIIDYDTKEQVWAAPGKAGENPHSIEILPSGNVVIASSTDGLVRIFNTANCVNNGDTVAYNTYDLPGAHGVLWDPEYEYLWAIGDYELAAYQVKDMGDGTEELMKVNGIGAELPTEGGHDLSADLMDSRYLWCTSGGVYRFDKEEGEFVEKYDQSPKLDKGGVKGFGNNQNNNYFFTKMKGQDKAWLSKGNPDWSTDTIYYGYWKSENFLYLKECVSAKSAFYKCRVFYGKYQ